MNIPRRTHTWFDQLANHAIVFSDTCSSPSTRRPGNDSLFDCWGSRRVRFFGRLEPRSPECFQPTSARAFHWSSIDVRPGASWVTATTPGSCRSGWCLCCHAALCTLVCGPTLWIPDIVRSIGGILLLLGVCQTLMQPRRFARSDSSYGSRSWLTQLWGRLTQLAHAALGAAHAVGSRSSEDGSRSWLTQLAHAPKLVGLECQDNLFFP
jgi:hypothetical protein